MFTIFNVSKVSIYRSHDLFGEQPTIGCKSLCCRVIEAREVAQASVVYFVRARNRLSHPWRGLIGANGRSKAWCLSIPKSLGSLVVSPMSDKNNMCILVLKDKR